jgi:hypothetical protein
VSSARNLGVREAQGTAILFCDDDVQVPEPWVAAMAEPLIAGTADIVAGAVRLAPALYRPDLTEFHAGLLADTSAGLGEPPRTAYGASMGGRKAIFDEGIRFIPRLGAGTSGFMEDHVWFLQAVSAGFRPTFVHEVVAEHHCDPNRVTWNAFVRRAKCQGRSEGIARIELEGTLAQYRDVRTLARTSVRRALSARGARAHSLPPREYLEVVRRQHGAVTVLVDTVRRLVRPSPPTGADQTKAAPRDHALP